MKGTGAGWDSCFYRIFLVGGLFGVVAAVVVAVLLTPDGSQIPLYVGFAAISLFFLLLLAYWWVQLAFQNYGTPALPPERAGAGAPDVSALQSWSTLFNAMVIQGGNQVEMNKYQRQGKGSLLIWFGMATVLVLYILVSMGLYMFGFIPQRFIFYVGLGVPALAVLMFVVSLLLLGKSTEAGEHLFLAPLGLSLVGLPSFGVIPTGDGMRTDVSGVTAIEGERFGRRIRIELGLDRVTTQVATPAPAFQVRSASGRLQAADGAPETVAQFLKGLRKAKRWSGVSLRAGPDGVRAERPSGGQNLWLYDLWLIERLLDCLK